MALTDNLSLELPRLCGVATSTIRLPILQVVFASTRKSSASGLETTTHLKVCEDFCEELKASEHAMQALQAETDEAEGHTNSLFQESAKKVYRPR